MDLDTGLLRAFVAVAEEHHFGRGAARLFITQQALSKRIARLEELVGAQLLERNRRAVRLTTTGRRFLGPARDALDAVDAATAAAGIGDPVKVDVMDAHTSAAGLLRRALEKDPTLRLEITARGAGRTAVDALREGDVDVAFGRASIAPWPTDIRRRCVLLEPIGLLVSAGHRLGERQELRMADLTDTTLRFPMHDAPPDWVSFVDELTTTFDVVVDRSGSNLGFDHFLGQAEAEPSTATFYGLNMLTPSHNRLRVIPIVAPTPVFAWAMMWRRRIPEALINRLSGSMPTTVPGHFWLPAADRAWLAP